MIHDSLLLLSDAQAVSSTGYSTNTIDLGNVTPKREIATGEPMEVVITVDTAADTASGNETYQFNFVQSANANLTSDDDLVTRIIAGSALTAGSVHRLPVPAGSVTKRYIGLEYVLGGTTPSVTVTAFLQPAAMGESPKTYYADGITIS